jgi:hypothetical protein
MNAFQFEERNTIVLPCRSDRRRFALPAKAEEWMGLSGTKGRSLFGTNVGG